MAEGSAPQAPTTSLEEVNRLFGRMFDLPVEMLAWEVFARAFQKLEGNAYTAAAGQEAYEAFMKDRATCPQHVLDFCRKVLKEG